MQQFKNEFTYRHYLEDNREEEFDKSFEEALNYVSNRWLGKEFPIIINGKEVFSNEKIEEYSPIDHRFIGKFQKGNREIADNAIEEALNAFQRWKEVDYRERAAIFQNAAKIFSKRKFEIAAAMSIENGKTRYESIGEVDEAIDFLNYYSLELLRNKGYIQKRVLEGSAKEASKGFQGAPSSKEKIRIVMKPYGVFGVIAPFNFPISISTGMSTGAMITGNTVVFKPSSTDNLSMLTGYLIYDILKEAGLPDGVFNYVTGPGSEVGDELVISNKVSGIVFTGSRETGINMIKKSYSLGLQKVFVVEMGGKNPTIVSKYANIDDAVDGVLSAAFGYAGQKCSACSRVYVHKSIKDQFIEKLAEKTKALKIGNPLIKDVYVGPIISDVAFEKYKKVINDIKNDQNSKIIVGGNTVDTGLNGKYVEPTIVLSDHDKNPYFKKELFLPILLIDVFDNFDEAIKKANDVEYGLTAGLYSKNRKEIKKFLDNIEAGVVYVNRRISATTGAIVGAHSFVGWKGSGITGKGTGNKYYLLQFMREQSQAVVG